MIPVFYHPFAPSARKDRLSFAGFNERGRGTTSSVCCGGGLHEGALGDLFRPASRSTYRGPAGPISLKMLHWSIFRALDAPQGEAFWFPRGSPGAFPSEGKVVERSETG